MTPNREEWGNNNELIPENMGLIVLTNGAVNGRKAGFGIYNRRQLEFMGYRFVIICKLNYWLHCCEKIEKIIDEPDWTP